MWIRQYRPSRKAVFTALMVLSLLAAMLPPQLTDSAKHATQLLVPLQDVVYSLTHWASVSGSRIGHPPDHDPLMREAWMNVLVAQDGRIEELTEENQRFSTLSEKAIHRALQAQVVAHDVAGWRDTTLIERGSELSVRTQDWVASRLFINQGLLNGVQEDRAVLAREVLLGRVERTSPYMSRVRLFSDIDSPPIAVRISRATPDGVVTIDYPCSLKGHGRGRMIIQDVDYRVVANAEEEDDPHPKIRVGDYVRSAAGQLGLPVPMVIGKITEIVQDPKRRLVYDLIIEPTIPIDQIRFVQVIPLIPTEIAME